MNEVFIDMRKENEWIRKYFNADFVSIDQLLNCIEDLDGKIDSLNEQIKDLTTTYDEDEDLYRDR